MDAGMDGLDALMAELAAAPKPAGKAADATATAPLRTQDKTTVSRAAKAPAPTVIDGFDAQGRLVLDAGGGGPMPPRAEEFVKRLKIFQMRVADPSTKERLNELLAASSADYRATASYYEDRPQLGEYTVNTEIKRMTYTVVPPQGGEAISDVEGIRSIYAASAGTDPGACRGRGKDSMGTGGGEGAGSANVDLVWRMANQSLLAGIAQPLHDTFGTPEDVELCISIHNTASAFHVNLHEAYVEATTDFKIATVGVGGSGAEADMLPLAHITGEIRVDVHAQRVRQVIKDVRLLMVFDDDLEAAARALAEGEARGMVYESPAKGASLLAIRDGMMTYTSSAASTAKSVGGGLMGAALSTGSSFFSGLGSMVREISAGVEASSPQSPAEQGRGEGGGEPLRLYNR